MEGTNTLLIVIVILVLAVFGTYWYTNNQKADNNQTGVELKLGGSENSGN